MKKFFGYIGDYCKTTDYWLILLSLCCSGLGVVLLMGIAGDGYWLF